MLANIGIFCQQKNFTPQNTNKTLHFKQIYTIIVSFLHNNALTQSKITALKENNSL